MVNFEDLKYKRPDFKKLIMDFKILLEDFNRSNSFKEANNLFIRINFIQAQFKTLEKICRYLAHNDNYEEISFFDESIPIYKEIENVYFQCLLNSKFRQELTSIWGEEIFRLAEMKLKIFSKDIREDLIEENKLITKYKSIMTSDLKLIPSESRMIGNITDSDERKNYYIDYRNKFLDIEDELKEVFLRLVIVRTRIAQKLGFKNYIELGNIRRGRSSYDSGSILSFKEDLLETLLPVSKHIREIQKKNLGLENVYYHKERQNFKEGDLNPKTDGKSILQILRSVLSHMSVDTKDYIEYMLTNGLIKIDSSYDREFNIYLEACKTPYLKANYNKFCEDVELIFNMIGGSFQYYMSKDYDVPQYNEMTPDIKYAIETSMEYIGYSGMSMLYGQDINKYVYWHLTKNLFLNLYRMMVDEFEYEVYTNYNMEYDQMKKLWLKLEKKYFPYRSYEDEYLGVYWLDNEDVFIEPLLSISKVIGFNMASKFLNDMIVDRQATMKKYSQICSIGASKGLEEIISLMGIDNPVENLCDKDKMIAHLNTVYSKIRKKE